jgi:hypothetical protein
MELYKRGQTLDQFLESVTTQRERWLKTAAGADLPQELVVRLRRVRAGLRFLIVAEDWCPDSVNTVPYVVKLATTAGIEARIVDRRVGQPLMWRHRTPDARTATPIVVLVRHGSDIGAWVERPLPLQRLFFNMRANPDDGRLLAERQSWYDADRGRTALSELVSLVERAAESRSKGPPG